MWDLAVAERTLMALMPQGARVTIRTDKKLIMDLILFVSESKFRARFVQHANLATIKDALSTGPKPDLLLLPKLTPAIREFLEQHFIGWVDQNGSAQISVGSFIISRDKIQVLHQKRQPRWTPSMLGVTEALLTGTLGTVSAMTAATNLAPSSAATALQNLSDMHLLTSDAMRGRKAGRKIVNYSELLSAYSDAVNARQHKFTMRVGVLWQDPIKSVTEVGKTWTKDGTQWAVTSSIAAAVLDPFSTQISPLEIYLDASSPVLMIAALKSAGLKPIDGGRLTVSPFPSRGTRKQVKRIQSVPVVPWPRVYADLQHAGVRGEELADHLRAAMNVNYAQ